MSKIKKISYGVLGFITILMCSVVLLLSTEAGNRFFFNRILSQQSMMAYEYQDGNIWTGVRLNNFSLTVDKTEIKVDTAKLHLGWRSLLFAQEAHLFKADLNVLQIIHTAPSDGTPFEYSDIKMPINLRVNTLNVKELQIKTATNLTQLHDIQIRRALWKGTHLSFKDTKFNLYGVFVKNAQGFMDFKQQGQYPLAVKADVELPVLHSLNIKNIKADVNGSLARINGGVAIRTPDLLTGWIVVQPMDDGVPMRGELQFKNYHLPFLDDEKLFAKNGVLTFKGNADGFDMELNTDLKGEHLPQGQYTAQMNTDFVNHLNIHNFIGDVMNGQVQLAGVVDWQDTDDVKWTAQGVFDRLKVPDSLLDADLKGFLPMDMTGQIQSYGSLKDGVLTKNQIQFNQKEQWSIDYQQSDAKKSIPVLDVAWQNIHREMPYITGLNSPTGKAKILLADKQQTIDIQTQLKPFQESFLPEGQYDAQLIVQNNRLDVPKFYYQLADAHLKATAQVLLPSKQQKLSWQAKVETEKFNPQLVNENIPVNQLTGHVDVKGYAKDATTQIIQTSNMNLVGRLANTLQSDIAQNVQLTGQSTTGLLFHAKNGAFKSYAVQYDGHLTASNQNQATADGVLKLKLSGTPNYVDIQQFYHQGIAGQIDVLGKLDLSQGVKWAIQSNLEHFKPHYFYASVNGDISGQIKTQGEWSDSAKKIDVQQLHLTGQINNKPLQGDGQLSVDLSQLDKGLKYQKFNANQLNLMYANNQIKVSGNQNDMLMQVNAAALNELHSSLKGRIYGNLTLSRQQRLQLNSNLAIDQLAYADTFAVKKVKLQGELPISEQTPSQLVLSIQDLAVGGRQIQQATADLTGTYISHVLKINSQQPRSKFYIQLAGGFNNQRQWLGQIQQGSFQSPRMELMQNRAADLVYHLDQKSLRVAKHCWNNEYNQLCLDEDITASPEQANFSVMTKNIYIQDLEAFIPDGLEITGQLNGYAKVSWKKGQTPQLDAQLFTKDGVIGLAGEQPNEEGSVLVYDDLSLIAKTTVQGLVIRTNMKTPSIGSGYANVLIKPEIKGMPMSGEVAFDQVQLQVLRPFIDDIRHMSGVLSVAGKIDGTLTQPEFYGDVRLKNGAFALNSLPVDLSNIELYMGIRQNTALINGTLNSGKGLATLSGKAAWGQQPYLRLKVKGDNLLVRQAPQIMAAVNTDMNLEVLPLQQRVSVDGKVHIPRALINMPEQSASAVEVSSDVRVVRSNQQQATTLAKAKAWDINANIALTLGDSIIFQGFDSRIPLTGKLDLTQRGKQMAMNATGAIGVTRQTQISAYGQTLNLTRAIARFNGALINPSLDIDARKTIQGDTVGVRVLGTAVSPNIQIYSDAGLSEQQALNALLTGSISDGISGTTTTDSFKSDVNNAVAAAGISMGLGGTRALTNQIGRAFGLSGLALDAQSSDGDTQVSLTGYITPDLYVRYGVGVFSTVNKLSLRYQMNKRLYLEASQDTERAIDLFYNWRF